MCTYHVYIYICIIIHAILNVCIVIYIHTMYIYIYNHIYIYTHIIIYIYIYPYMLLCKHYVYIICKETSETLSVTEEIDSAPLLAAGPGKWYCAASSPGASAASGTHGFTMALPWLYHGLTMVYHLLTIPLIG